MGLKTLVWFRLTTSATAVAKEAATATLAHRCQRRAVPNIETFVAATMGAKCSATALSWL